MHTKLKNSNIQEANLKEDFLSSNKVKGEQWEKKKGCKEGLSGVDSLVAKSQVQCINLSSCIITSYSSARKKKKNSRQPKKSADKPHYWWRQVVDQCQRKINGKNIFQWCIQMKSHSSVSWWKPQKSAVTPESHSYIEGKNLSGALEILICPMWFPVL